MKHDYKKLFISIIAVNLIGIISGLISVSGLMEWYQTLNKPFFTPPSWVFAPIWTTLYILIGISFYLVWNRKDFDIESNAFSFFSIQLSLNFFWSIIFFGMHNIMFALIIIILLEVFIYLTIWEFYKIDKRAGYILIPYAVWVFIAILLNLGIYILN